MPKAASKHHKSPYSDIRFLIRIDISNICGSFGKFEVRETLGVMDPVSKEFDPPDYDPLPAFLRVRSTPSILCRMQLGPLLEIRSKRFV